MGKYPSLSVSTEMYVKPWWNGTQCPSIMAAHHLPSLWVCCTGPRNLRQTLALLKRFQSLVVTSGSPKSLFSLSCHLLRDFQHKCLPGRGRWGNVRGRGCFICNESTETPGKPSLYTSSREPKLPHGECPSGPPVTDMTQSSLFIPLLTIVFLKPGSRDSDWCNLS